MAWFSYKHAALTAKMNQIPKHVWWCFRRQNEQWIGLDVGRNAYSYGGLDWVSNLVDWVGLDFENWTQGHLWYIASQQPELELPCFTEGNTTKRTRSERVLYFLIRTNVQNAFGKITNAFARTLVSLATQSARYHATLVLSLINILPSHDFLSPTILD